MDTPRDRIEWLQALRGFAALLVLAFHARPFLAASVPALGPAIDPARWGFGGVDVFFALSGFVIFRAAARARQDGRIGAFVRHRFLRIYLGYWPALVVLALAGAWVIDRPAPDAADLFRSIFLVQSTFSGHWLPPAWSLEYELYFYLGAVGLVLAAPKRPVLGVATLLLLLIGWDVGCNAGCIWIVPEIGNPGRPPLEALLAGHAIVFFAGALVAVACDRLRDKGVPLDPPVYLIATGLAVLAGHVGATSHAASNATLGAAAFGLMALALVVACIALEESPFRPPRWLVKVGDASYGLFLLQTTLLGVFFTWIAAVSSPGVLAWLASAAALVVPVVIVLLSLGWFRWIEDPLYRAGRRAFDAGKQDPDTLVTPAMHVQRH